MTWWPLPPTHQIPLRGRCLTAWGGGLYYQLSALACRDPVWCLNFMTLFDPVRGSISGALVPRRGLQKNTSLWNNNIVLGLPYDISNCSMIKQTLIDEFHPVMVGVLDTLNWPAMLELSMWKHAWLMLTKDRYYFLSHSNFLSVILIAASVAKLVYTGKLPGLTALAKGAVGSSNAYITGFITSPAHP